MAKVVAFWVEDKTSHNIPLNQSLVQRRPTHWLYEGVAAVRRILVEGKSQVGRGWLMRFRKRSHSTTENMQGEAASADVEAASYPKICLRQLMKVAAPSRSSV